jgi:hypothetical protein
MIRIVSDRAAARRVDEECINAIGLAIKRLQILKKPRTIAVETKSWFQRRQGSAQLVACRWCAVTLFPSDRTRRRDRDGEKPDQEFGEADVAIRSSCGDAENCVPLVGLGNLARSQECPLPIGKGNRDPRFTQQIEMIQDRAPR